VFSPAWFFSFFSGFHFGPFAFFCFSGLRDTNHPGPPFSGLLDSSLAKSVLLSGSSMTLPSRPFPPFFCADVPSLPFPLELAVVLSRFLERTDSVGFPRLSSFVLTCAFGYSGVFLYLVGSPCFSFSRALFPPTSLSCDRCSVLLFSWLQSHPAFIRWRSSALFAIAQIAFRLFNIRLFPFLSSALEVRFSRPLFFPVVLMDLAPRAFSNGRCPFLHWSRPWM